MDYEELEKKFGKFKTDQESGIAPPPLQKPYPENAELIDLISPDKFTCGDISLAQAIGSGTCRIAAYNQKLIYAQIGVDTKDEFVVYLSPVGKI